MNDEAFHSPTHVKNRKFVDFARSHIGARVRIDNFSRDFGRPSIVWRLTGSDGSRTWLKHHERTNQFRRELIGLEKYVPALGKQTWWSSPTLVAKDDTLEVILMSEVKGVMLEETQLSAQEEWSMFCLAGQFIRKLHDLESGAADNTAAATNIRDRLEYYLNATDASVDLDTLHWTRSLIDEVSHQGVFKSVPCHRDFSPRNWILDRGKSDIRFGIIDWERCGQDLWLQDVQRMAYDHWYDSPQLCEAFFAGYGRELTNTEQLQLDVLCLVAAIASISWAKTHHDAQFEARNRQMINRIRAKHAEKHL